MRQYITRRLLQMIPVLIGVSIVIFLIVQLAPGDSLTGKMDKGLTAERKQELRHQMGLDLRLDKQYLRWAGGVIHGNFGESTNFKQPVGKVMNTYIWNSFYLAILSLILSVLISIPIGVISATKQYSKFDGFFTVFALIGISMPSFFFGMLLIKIFAVDLGVLPVTGMTTAGSVSTGLSYGLDVARHMILPLIVLTLSSVAGLMRYTRSSMLEVIRQDYIRTARAKGLKEKVVIYKHALRNGMIPVITLLGFWLPGLFSGAFITETIFGWPGIGPIAINAVSGRDYPLLMGINILLAALTLFGNLIADVTYAVVDPRIRLK
ncbi:ABC transporter permease [Clostridium tagluense]|uniref:ABC transporter permease n=1 Tax=Clostridium tagluense TaxID=360422 RepID=UPI001CF58CB6|nr:ABC transporter permease [Clostridium tagluense]MCB2300537.1 ABC transporter permease [Clostridium tagluense]MCB2312532.1 ABC transporter permease [Clostridium tagluense]MCB2317201.1 ABC transporter permease [Clostridium tagluense]MCB2322065.1 ABC transporter permease [Clostridium tagluense]MCB2327150.1 ABC transporter permease [Clostridium tagluense]